MAGALLLGGTLTLHACVLPPYEHYLDPPPAARNRPPRIILNQISPPDQPHVMGVSCDQPQEFRLAVEDLDLQDTLFVNVFIDYGTDGFSPIYRSFALANRDSARELVTFSFPPNSSGIPLFTVGTHLVDAVVSDAPLDSQREPLQPPSPDGGVADLRYADIYTWVVDSRTGGCQ